MKIRFLIPSIALFSLFFFVGCPQTPDTPSKPIVDLEVPVNAESLLTVPEQPLTIPELPVVDPPPPLPPVVEPPAPPVVEPPAPPVVTPEPSQETAEEKVVRERTAQLGGTIRKNPDGRIIGIVIENNDLSLSDIQVIGKLTDLESIRITGPSVDDTYVEAMSGLTKLKSVDIENGEITDRALEILKTLPDINALLLRRNLKLTDNAIKLFAEFPKLRTLKILYNGFTPTSLYDLENLKTVRVLDLRGLQVGDDTLIFLSELENLEELRIRSGSVSNAGIAELVKCQKLKTLELQDTSVGAGCGEFFKEMKGLRTLQIFRGGEFSAEAVAELGVLTNLEMLQLRAIGCNNEALLALKPLVNLRRVDFSELPGVDSATVIDVIKSYPKLADVRIFAIPVDDSVAAFLATIPALRSVALPATSITDTGLDALTALSNLTTLEIYANKERITLQGAGVLSKFKTLQRLVIPETLNDPALKSEILKSSPKCVITVNTYSQET